MTVYIKREYAVDAVLDVYCDTPDIDLSCEKFEAAIRKIQAADVAPVVHGRWRWVGQDRWNDCYECSQCGKMNADNSKFCPNCGADMRLEGEEQR